MIIVVRQQAQISNRLVALSALMAHCLRHRIKLLILSLGDYQDILEPQPANPLVRTIFVPARLHQLTVRLLNSRLIQLLSRWIGLRSLDRQRAWSEIAPALLRSRIWLINGSGDWCRTMPAIEADQAPVIRRLLSFRSPFHQKAAAISQQLRQDCDVLVGVHARRGDYASHRNGCWFYNEADYLRWIHQAPSLFPAIDANRIGFVVCSNDGGFLASCQGEAIAISPMGSAAGDQLLLSHCDLILGPPSTFSVWAAFLTDTRLLHIFRRDQNLEASQIRRSTLFYAWQPNREDDA